MVIYESQTGAATFINARETAGSRASINMFKGNGDLAQIGKSLYCWKH